jgi:hypothetical protein
VVVIVDVVNSSVFNDSSAIFNDLEVNSIAVDEIKLIAVVVDGDGIIIEVVLFIVVVDCSVVVVDVVVDVPNCLSNIKK